MRGVGSAAVGAMSSCARRTAADRPVFLSCVCLCPRAVDFSQYKQLGDVLVIPTNCVDKCEATTRQTKSEMLNALLEGHRFGDALTASVRILCLVLPRICRV